MSTPPPTTTKSAMARSLERLKARKKSTSPLVKLSDKAGPQTDSEMSSSMPSPAASSANMITYSFSQNDGTVTTVPLTQVESVLMPPKTVKMTFLFACHVLFNVPVTENQRRATVQRDYVVQVFNYGTVFVTGSDINDDLKSLLAKGKMIRCTFHHDDTRRKSFNYVEVFYDDVVGTKFLKPASAVVTLKTILNNEHFFIQESAFKRIDDYFQMEFKDTSLITFTKLLGSRIEDFSNINLLPTDARLFLGKVQEWIEESSEIEVLPPSISDSGFNESEFGSTMTNSDSKYFPLTLEQEVIVTTCVTCLHTFAHAVERLAHYGISSKCKQAFDEDPKQLDRLDLIFKDLKDIPCSKCHKIFENVWNYCLHRDGYLFEKVFPCVSCTAILWSAQEFIKHRCTSRFLNQTEISYFHEKDLQVPSNHETLLSCVFCQIKPFQFISGLVIHLFDSGKQCKQHMLSRNGNETVTKPIHLSEILLGGRVEVETSLKCCQCSIEFQNEVSYLLHMDHHQLKAGHQIECKVCKQTFKSSCQFHRHNCKVGGKSYTMGCLICIKLDPTFQIQFNGNSNNQAGDIEIKEEPIEENSKYGDNDDGVDDYIEELQNDDHGSLETYISNYDRKRSLWKESGQKQDRQEWFVCVDCVPHKILKENDQSMDKHFAEYADHYKINPAWWYSKFQLYIPDIAKQEKYQNMINPL